MRFLVVDDGYDWIKFHSQNIKHTMPHAQIDVAMSGFEALNMVLKQDENYYDIILSDMQMEDVEGESYAGIWLIKRLLASGKCEKAKIIIMPESKTRSKQKNGIDPKILLQINSAIQEIRELNFICSGFLEKIEKRFNDCVENGELTDVDSVIIMDLVKITKQIIKA